MDLNSQNICSDIYNKKIARKNPSDFYFNIFKIHTNQTKPYKYRKDQTLVPVLE